MKLAPAAAATSASAAFVTPHTCRRGRGAACQRAQHAAGSPRPAPPRVGAAQACALQSCAFAETLHCRAAPLVNVLSLLSLSVSQSVLPPPHLDERLVAADTAAAGPAAAAAAHGPHRDPRPGAGREGGCASGRAARAASSEQRAALSEQRSVQRARACSASARAAPPPARRPLRRGRRLQPVPA